MCSDVAALNPGLAQRGFAHVNHSGRFCWLGNQRAWEDGFVIVGCLKELPPFLYFFVITLIQSVMLTSLVSTSDY